MDLVTISMNGYEARHEKQQAAFLDKRQRLKRNYEKTGDIGAFLKGIGNNVWSAMAKRVAGEQILFLQTPALLARKMIWIYLDKSICEIIPCDRTFTRISDMKRHMKNVKHPTVAQKKTQSVTRKFLE